MAAGGSGNGLYDHLYKKFFAERDSHVGYSFQQAPGGGAPAPIVTFREKLRWWTWNRGRRRRAPRPEAESTPRAQHQKIKDVADRAHAYAIPSAIVDGNDVEAVYLCAREVIQRARSGGGPTLVEAKTTRWRGHHEADNQSYRDKEEFQAALQNDPIARWGKELLVRGVSQSQLDEIIARVEKELKEAIEYAQNSPLPDPADARADIFTPFKFEEI